VRLAIDWNTSRLEDFIDLPPTVAGEVGLREVNPTNRPAIGVARRYPVKNGQRRGAVRLFASGLLPKLSSLTGFTTYVVIELGEQGLLTFGGFRDRESAVTSVDLTREWVREDLSNEELETPLRAPVQAGSEPYMVVGAMAGG
jgi:hypothetical protein